MATPHEKALGGKKYKKTAQDISNEKQEKSLVSYRGGLKKKSGFKSDTDFWKHRTK